MKVGIYARVLAQEQQILPLHIKDLRQFVKQRKWEVEVELSDGSSGVET